MDIRKELLAPTYQSKELATRVARYSCTSQDTFAELMDAFLSDDSRLSQRVAYVLGIAGKMRPDLIHPYLEVLIAQLGRTDVHDAVIRNCVRILQDTEIPEAMHGSLMVHCFDFIQKRDTPIAIKAFSLTVLFNLSKIYPDIRNELRIIIGENMDYETAAFRSRGKKILVSLGSGAQR